MDKQNQDDPDSNVTESNLSDRYRGLRPFKPGQSGNPAGRPKGARSRFGETFCDALLGDFEQHGSKVIEQARLKDPVSYLHICARLIPKDMAENSGADVFKQILRMMQEESHARKATIEVAPYEDGSGKAIARSSGT